MVKLLAYVAAASALVMPALAQPGAADTTPPQKAVQAESAGATASKSAPAPEAPATPSPLKAAPASRPNGATAAVAPPASVFPPGVYGVIVQVKLGPDRRMSDMSVSRILGATAEGGGEVTGRLPERYVANVRKRLSKVKFSETDETYRFFVFDPLQPERVDLGPPPEKQ